jgi:exopolysaccharide production protein ExoQ
MENNTITALPYNKLTAIQERFLSFLFVLFLYFCFVGLLPFGPRQPYVLEETGAGNLLLQFFYISIAASFGLVTLIRQDFRFLKMMGIAITASLLWALASMYWSDTGGIAFRRATYTVIVVMTVFMSTALLGPQKIFNLFFYTLLGLIIASLLSGLFVHNAIHREGMRGADELIGLWRGVFYHKNGAGAASAFLFLLCFQQLVYGSVIKNKLHLWIGLFSAIALMYLAFSKTSLLLIAPVLVISGAIYCLVAGRNVLYRTLSVIVLITAIIIAVIIGFQLDVLRVLDNPDALTGRSKIWKSVWAMIEARPWLGFGYGSAFEVGVDTPFLKYAIGWDGRIELVHAHNGYLQIAVEQGFIGLVLALIAFIITPLLKIIYSQSIPKELLASLLAILMFFIFHNFFEVSLMYRSLFIWVMALIVIANIQYYSLLKPHENPHLPT